MGVRETRRLFVEFFYYTIIKHFNGVSVSPECQKLFQLTVTPPEVAVAANVFEYEHVCNLDIRVFCTDHVAAHSRHLSQPSIFQKSERASLISRRRTARSRNCI